MPIRDKDSNNKGQGSTWQFTLVRSTDSTSHGTLLCAHPIGDIKQLMSHIKKFCKPTETEKCLKSLTNSPTKYHKNPKNSITKNILHSTA